MMRNLLVFALIAANCYLPAANAGELSYCMALRGNGQSEPSHWGAMANLVERAGLPQAQAGGSSATISMFLLDSIAANPWVRSAAPSVRGIRAAFLLKSLSGISAYLLQQKSVHAGLVFLQSLMNAKAAFDANGDLSTLELLAKAESLESLQSQGTSLYQLLQDLKEMGIGSVPRYAEVLAQLEKFLTTGQIDATNLPELQFYAQDLYKAISTLGNFDAADPDLFFRDGIIDFNQFSLQVGKIATFLAGVAWNEKTHSLFEKFVANCEPKTVGKSWSDIVAAKPACQAEMSTTLAAYFGQKLNWDKINIVKSRLGQNIPTFPVVSVLTDGAYTQALDAYNQYHDHLDRSASTNFKIQDIDLVKFGYWGETGDLDVIQAGLNKSFPNDEKSKRFLPLGSGSWLSILAISPAEPGLASLQPMHLPGGQPAYAAGGWSDLHPVLALRELPKCKAVIYVTRKGGESLFAQGVAKRLLNFDRDWNLLEDTTPALTEQNNLINAKGDPTDMTSLWSLLYNVANPASSYMTAVGNADAVLCTDWDAYTVQSQFTELINQSYTSPFVFNPKSPAVGAALLRAGAKSVPTGHLNDSDPKTGAPLWVGCRP